MNASMSKNAEIGKNIEINMNADMRENKSLVSHENKKKEIISLILIFLGAIAGLFGVAGFSRYVMMSLPLVARIFVIPLMYWLIALIPLIVIRIGRERLSDFGFTKEKLPSQILMGFLIGGGMSLILTLIPHLAGFGDFVDSGNRYKVWWQFVFEFVYCIFAVGFVEELIFRGFLFEKLRRIFGSAIPALIASSVLFGLFHILTGDVGQMIITAFIGAWFGFCRMKFRNCSLLSLIIAHGFYDFMITVWVSVFLM